MVSPVQAAPGPTEQGGGQGPLGARREWGGWREILPLCALDDSFLRPHLYVRGKP